MHAPVRMLGGIAAMMTALTLMLFALGATAGEKPETVRKLKEAGAILPLEQIVQRAQAIKAGEIIETELERRRERYVYEVEILDAGGRVWEIYLDAKTGQLIKVEQEY